MSNPRICALEALKRTRKDKAYSNLVLDAVLEEFNLSSQDKAFAAALYYGVLERIKTLDYMIGRLCSSGTKKIAPLVMDCLRLGLYQIKFMDKVPDSAAVNETVKIVKKKCSAATGFVNAVLRRAAREDIELPSGNSDEDISVKYSCDISIVKSLLKDYGADITGDFLASSLSVAPIFIKVNTIKTSTEELINRFSDLGIKCQKCALPDAIQLENVGSVEKNPMYTEGLFHVEDLAAQWAVYALDPKPGDRLLDMCAAPGGKTFSAAQHMENKGEILAFDLYEKRAGLIKTGADRLGISIIKASSGDSTVYNPDLGEFDRVLCDAPCSGIGIIRRKPDIKYKSNEDFNDLPQLQLKLLKNAAKYVKNGGRLVYSTCTLRKEENEEVVEQFMADHLEFSLRKVNFGNELLAQKTFMPMNDNTDGFFVAVLEKE